jgi:putative ABC transport system permease protein
MSRMYTSDPGFNPKGLLRARVVLADTKYSDLTRAQNFFDNVLKNIAPLPGVKSVAAAQCIPYDGNYRNIPYAIDGMPGASPPDHPLAIGGMVTPEYFAVLGVPLLRGRVFSAQASTDANPEALINQTMARRHWPNADPIGRRVRFGAKLERTFTIIGVVADTLGQTESDIPRPQIYLSVRQFPVRSMAIVVRSESDSPAATASLAGAIRQAAKQVDPGQPIYNVRSMEDLRAELFNPSRVAGKMMLLFGAISAFLAAIGIYSVLAYAVAARTREFGIRMALGAGRGHLLSMVTARGLKLAAVGLALGLAGSLATTRFMASILYHVSPTDVPTFLLTGLLMLSLAVVACYLPARQASQADPVLALRRD